MKAKYLVLEGSEGTGKGTQTAILVNLLRSRGLKVLDTKEPGTPHSPLTMELRKIMLDSKYDTLGYQKLFDDLSSIKTNPNFQNHFAPDAKDMIDRALSNIAAEKKMGLNARELISQAIRCIHLQMIVIPAMEEYDYIIQDRGILSGLVYGVACGVDYQFIETLSNAGIGAKTQQEGTNIYNLYDQIILFRGDVAAGLKRALTAKKEFEAGDAMENKGVSFLDKVSLNFNEFYKKFKKVSIIEVENKNIEKVTEELLKVLI
jgi:thymidylate kinase